MKNLFFFSLRVWEKHKKTLQVLIPCLPSPRNASWEKISTYLSPEFWLDPRGLPGKLAVFFEGSKVESWRSMVVSKMFCDVFLMFTPWGNDPI